MAHRSIIIWKGIPITQIGVLAPVSFSWWLRCMSLPMYYRVWWQIGKLSWVLERFYISFNAKLLKCKEGWTWSGFRLRRLTKRYSVKQWVLLFTNTLAHQGNKNRNMGIFMLTTLSETFKDHWLLLFVLNICSLAKTILGHYLYGTTSSQDRSNA